MAGAFLRCPSLLIHGRMWGEELTVFLLGGWNQSFLESLKAPHFGYYSLWDNVVASVVIHCLPLQFVAFCFTWSSVIILLLTGYLVYEAEFLPTRTAKILGVLALLFTSPSIETWLNLLTSEFYFGIWAAVLLVSDASRLRVRRLLMLSLAVLSGPLTTILAPIYFIRAIVTRQRTQVWQAVVVCGGGLVQLAVAFATSMAGRGVHPRPLLLGAIVFNKNLVEFLLARIVAKANFYFQRDHLHFSTAALLGSWLVVLLIFGGMIMLVRRQRGALSLLLIGLWLAFFESAMALNGGTGLIDVASGERYAYTPNVLFVMALIVVSTTAQITMQRKMARVLLGVAFFSGAVDFVLLPLRHQVVYQAEPWRQQVLRWEKNPNCTLQPLPNVWSPVHLPPKS